MAGFYQHKQTLFIALFCVIAIALVAVYVNNQNGRTDAAQVTAESTSDRAIADSNQNDAIGTSSDWKEQFLSTTTKVSAKKDTKNTDTASSEPLTLTDQLGRTFLTGYMKLKQADLTTDSDSVKSVVDQTISNALSAAKTPKVYLAKDIIVEKNGSQAETKAYANAVASAFATYSPRQDAAAIMNDALDTNDMSLLVNIDPIVASYDKMIQAILAIRVPGDLATDHLNLVNSLSAIRYVSKGLRDLSTDPMQTMVAIGQYEPAHASLRNTMLEMRDYFTKDKIVFSNDDPGIMFFTVQ